MDQAGSFDSTKTLLQDLLKDARDGKLQLPDFQRGWVWDDEHVRSLLASVSLSFPIGAIMLLQTGNPAVRFKAQPIEGVTAPKNSPDWLILDGQQRLTSLYQALLMDKPVHTRDARQNPVDFYYYIDLKKALEPGVDREETIFGVPPNHIVTYRRDVQWDLSTTEKECASEALPLRLVFDAPGLHSWMMTYVLLDGSSSKERLERWNTIHAEVLSPFQQYHVPVIQLSKSTSKVAVCKVFEKVNTGGVSLTVFELLTASYAAEEFQLRKDWAAREKDLHVWPVLSEVGNTDFLMTITLLSTLARKRTRPESAVGCKRNDILDLDLSEYSRWAQPAVDGYVQAAKFLYQQRIFAPRDIPYRTQLIPLAAILADLGTEAELEGNLAKLRRWFWCGVLGELYGGSIESRFARDVPQVLEWIRGGPEPDTVTESNFRKERLRTLRTRQSAAYKGVHALLMRDGAADLRSGHTIDLQVYFRDDIDIHHIFPVAFSKKAGLDSRLVDSIVNKTPLSSRTNQIIGGSAPSQYIPKLEKEADVSASTMDDFLRSHLVDPQLLRADNFSAFYKDRESALVERIEAATGKPVEGAAKDLDAISPAEDGEGVAAVHSIGPTLLVEGSTDKEYLEVAVSRADRAGLLEGIEIQPCLGADKVLKEFLIMSQAPGGPVMALFDRDSNGKAAKDTLLKRFGVPKAQVVTYGDLLEGNPDGVEAEDLLPQSILQKFVDHYGENVVLAEKQMNQQLGKWHYGFTGTGKELIGAFLKEHATADDMGRFVKLAELVRTRMDVSANQAKPALLAPVAMAPKADGNGDASVEPVIHPTGEPWKLDGRKWHLEQRCSPTTRPILEAVVDTVSKAVTEAKGPDYGQRNYISWMAGARNWAIARGHRTTVWLTFNGVALTPDDIGRVLGFEQGPTRDELRWKSPAGSYVTTNWRGQAGVHFESVLDVTGDAANRLADLLKQAWRLRSTAVAQQQAAGFDWRRIDAAIKALPPDRWTSYGELAELGGTAPVPVGQHVANVPLPNAHHVLDINGRLRPGFHWADPNDTRDVRAELEEDGIRFGESGAADPTQRMTADDLAALIGDEGFDDAAPQAEPASSSS